MSTHNESIDAGADQHFGAYVSVPAKANGHAVIVLQEIFGVLFPNPPFVVYIFMFILAIFGLSFPDDWLIPIRPLANANTLLSIFTIKTRH